MTPAEVIADYFERTADATKTVDEIGAAFIGAGILTAGIALFLLLRRFRDVSNFIAAAHNSRSVTVGIEATGLPAWAEPSDLYGNHIFAFAGDEVVCDGPHHHLICTFSESVERGEIVDPLVFVGWQQPKPALGQEPTGDRGLTCEHCGGSWWLPGNHFHFRDGWR